HGRATFAVEPGVQHYNPIGVVHGGLAATLLDSAMGCAVQSTLDAGIGYTTLDLNTTFLRPMTVDTGRVVCEAVVIHTGGRVATAEGRVFSASTGKLLATGTCSCVILRPESSPLERRGKVLLVTAVAVFMGFLDVTIVNIAFPDMRASFPDDSLASLSWVLNAYNIVFAALLVPAGRVADIVGRRRLFFIGMALFLAASAVCGVAPSEWGLVAARAVPAARGGPPGPASPGPRLPEVPVRR